MAEVRFSTLGGWMDTDGNKYPTRKAAEEATGTKYVTQKDKRAAASSGEGKKGKKNKPGERTPRANPQAARRKILAEAGVEVTDDFLKMPYDEFTAKFGEPERKPRRKKGSGQASRGGTRPVTVTVGDPDVPKAPPNVTPPDPKSDDKKPRTQPKVKNKKGKKDKGSSTKPMSTPKPPVDPPKPPSPPKSPKKAPSANPIIDLFSAGAEPSKRGKPPRTFFGKKAPKGQMGAMVAQQRQSPQNLSTTKKEVSNWLGRVGQTVKSEAKKTVSDVNRIGRPSTKVTTGPMSKAGPQMTSPRTSPPVPISRAGGQATNVRHGPRRGPRPRQSFPMPKYVYYPKALRTDPDSKKFHARETARKVVSSIKGGLNAGPAHGGRAGLDNPSRNDIPDQMRPTARTAEGRAERAAARTLANKSAEPARLFAQLITGKRAEANPVTGRITVKRTVARPIITPPWRELPGLQSSGTVTGSVVRRVGLSELDDAPKNRGRNLPSKPRVRMTTLGPMSSSPVSGIGVGTGPGSGSPTQPKTKTGRPKKTSYKPPTLGRMARADRPTTGARPITRPATPISPNTPTTRPSNAKPVMRYPGTLLYESPSGNFAMQTGKREVQFFTKGGNRPVISTPVSSKQGGSTTRVKTKQLDLKGFATDVVSDLEAEWSAKDMRRRRTSRLAAPSLSDLAEQRGRVARQVAAHNKIWGTPEARMGRRASTLNLNARGTYVPGESKRQPASGRSVSMPRTYGGGKASWVRALQKRGLLGLIGGATSTGVGVAVDVLMNPDSAAAPPSKSALAAEKKRRQEWDASINRANRATQRVFPTFLDRIR